MAKLEDIAIRTPDPFLKLFMSDLITFWNGGTFEFPVISTPPTDTPQGAQLRLFDSGVGSVKLYFYSPTTSAWYSVTLT